MRRALPLAVLLFALPATAEVRIGIGGDYVFNRTGMFELLLAVDTKVARPLAIGGRVGVLILTDPGTLGIPIDFDLRFLLANNRVYLEALGGPWILFENYPVKGHVAFGFGLNARAVSFGIEAGYLTSRGPHLGLRLALRI
ncbi:MAG: hypothetical protein ACT4TC_03045 [Myxococcaceae bacterium]